jgi:hypothetical protein
MWAHNFHKSYYSDKLSIVIKPKYSASPHVIYFHSRKMDIVIKVLYFSEATTF